jgi:predicted PurR-regulated permease PerM
MNRGFYKVKCSNWRTLSMQDRFWVALLPAGLYLCIHLVEGETITPMLLARPLHSQPSARHSSAHFLVLDVGVPGAILAVSMLAITKIISGRIQTLAALGHFLEG